MEEKKKVDRRKKCTIRITLNIVFIIILLFIIINLFALIDSRFSKLGIDIYDIKYGCNCGCACNVDEKNHMSCGCGVPDCACNNGGYYLTITEEPEKGKIGGKKKLGDSVPNTNNQGYAQGEGYNNNNKESSIYVYDEDNVQFGQNVRLNIFKQHTNHIMKDKIAPGSKNSYQFVIRDTNDFALKYNLYFNEENKYNINMKFRLKRNDEYVVGSDNKYVTSRELSLYEMILPVNTYDYYTLEWQWLESNNDTAVGESIDAFYGLSIGVTAEQY